MTTLGSRRNGQKGWIVVALERPALARLQAPDRLLAEGTGVSESVWVEELLRRGIRLVRDRLARDRFWRQAGTRASHRRGLMQVSGAAVLEVVYAVIKSILSLLNQLVYFCWIALEWLFLHLGMPLEMLVYEVRPGPKMPGRFHALRWCSPVTLIEQARRAFMICLDDSRGSIRFERTHASILIAHLAELLIETDHEDLSRTT